MNKNKLKKIPQIRISEYVDFFRDFLTFTNVKVSRYPEIFRVKMLTHNLIFIHNPTLIKHVLVENHKNYKKGYDASKIVLGDGLVISEGKEWLERRRHIQPFFKTDRLEENVGLFGDFIRRYFDSNDFKDCPNFTKEIEHIVVGLVGESLFETRLSAEEIDKVRTYLKTISQTAYLMFLSPILIPTWVEKIPIKNKQSRALDQLRLFVDQLRTRVLQKNNENGFIQTLNKSYSTQQLNDEIVTFLITGQETVIPSLEWCFYTICKYPHIQESLEREVLTRGLPQSWSQKDIYRYPYLLSFISEILRLYPPAYAYSRMAIDDDVVNGYKINKRDFIIINVYGMHHHPDFWTNPNEVNPDRFAEVNLKGEHKHQYLPFGLGPRTCIANNYAIQEIAIILAEFISRYHMEITDIEKPMPRATFTLGLDRPLKLKITKRVLV